MMLKKKVENEVGDKNGRKKSSLQFNNLDDEQLDNIRNMPKKNWYSCGGYSFSSANDENDISFEQLHQQQQPPVWVPLSRGLGRSSCCLLYTSPSPRDGLLSRMPSSA